MEIFFLKTQLFIESLADENNTISKLSTAIRHPFQFIEEDENRNKEWSCNVLGFYCQLNKYGNPKLNNWYSFGLRPDSNLPENSDAPDMWIDFHFKRLFSQLGFENVLTSEEFNAEFHRRNS